MDEHLLMLALEATINSVDLLATRVFDGTMSGEQYTQIMDQTLAARTAITAATRPMVDDRIGDA